MALPEPVLLIALCVPIRSPDDGADNLLHPGDLGNAADDALQASWARPPQKIIRLVTKAIVEWGMIQPGDDGSCMAFSCCAQPL